MEKITIDQLEGGKDLCIWFGGVPSFHDAALRELELRQGALGRLVAHTFRIESETDGEGYFKLSKHVKVTLTIFDLAEAELFEFKEAAIIFGLDFEIEDENMYVVR